MTTTSDRREALRRLHREEHGEGVISAAIAVLIMAFLGAAMWVGFNTIWDDTETNVRDQVEQIGDETGE
ncbi:MAG: hypothetical protein H0W25_19720 [Acidimicrobiia bacterium]|nr:hypothetical protein [Acidimicrobiia bacterium]